MSHRTSGPTQLTVGLALLAAAIAVTAPAWAQSPTPVDKKLAFRSSPMVYQLRPDLVVLPPVILNSVPATGTIPAGYRIQWKVKNQGQAATANRVRLVITCQVVPSANAPQVCVTLNNDFYLSWPPGQPPSTPVPLKPGQESEPIFTLATAATVRCDKPHARVTAVVDPDNQYDEGPAGEANNTRVWEICNSMVIAR